MLAVKKKKHHTCEKKNEKKDFLEWYVVEQTVEYVLTPKRIEYIAARIVAKYDEEFNDKRIKELERQFKKLDNEINAAVDASLSAPEKVRQKYFEKIEMLETRKADIEFNLASLKIANGHRYTKEQIIAWLKSFCRGDALDETFQRRIIDTLINSVYVYDDKIVIYYNVKGGKQVSHMDMCSDMENLTPVDGGADSCGGTDKKGVRISHDPPCQAIKSKNRVLWVLGFFVFALTALSSETTNKRTEGRQMLLRTRGRDFGCTPCRLG